MEQVADAIEVADASGRIVWANAAAKQLHHRDPTGATFDMIPKVWGEAYTPSGERANPDNWALPRALRGESVNVETRLVRTDGTSVDVHVTAVPIRQADGAIIAAVAVARDITQRKQAEKVREALYAEEQRLRRESERQNERMALFVRALIHEIKTPLTPMLGASEMLAAKLEDESLMRLARNISRGARNLSRRLNDLIDLMKGETGILSIRYETLRVKDLLADVVEYVLPEAERKHLSISQDVDAAAPPFRADGDRIRQVMFNLLNNAMKFTPPGGHITVSASSDGKDMVIAVSDTGCGIARKDRERLFQPYQLLARGDGQTALGIGLPLSRMLVELHGGRMWVQSRKGKGSIFAFSLPLKPARRAERTEERPL